MQAHSESSRSPWTPPPAPIRRLAFASAVAVALFAADLATDGARHFSQAYILLVIFALGSRNARAIFVTAGVVTAATLVVPFLVHGATGLGEIAEHRLLGLAVVWTAAILCGLYRARIPATVTIPVEEGSPEATPEALSEEEAPPVDVEENREDDRVLHRVETLFSTMSSVLIEIDEEYRVHRWNESAARVLGPASDEVEGCSLFQCGIRWDEEDLGEILEKVAANRTEAKGDIVFEDAAGEKCVLGCSASWFDDERGHRGMLLLGRDITESVKGAESQRRLIAAVEHLSEAIVVTDREGGVVYANPAFTEITGYAPEEANEIGLCSIFPPEEEGEDHHQVRSTLEQGQTWTGRFSNVRRDGSHYEEESTISPIRDEEGEISHFVAVRRDVSDLLAMETQLRHAQKLESIGQLAAGIAHEINTPTQYVGDNTRFLQEAFEGLADLLAICEGLGGDNEGEESAEELVARMTAAAADANLDFMIEQIPEALAESLTGLGRVAKIVKAMKAFSHPGGDERELANLNEGIERTVTLCTNEWKYVSDVEMDLDPDLPLVSCLPGEINQVILNMVVNAAHAIEAKLGKSTAEKGAIGIRTCTRGDDVEIRISDSGSGMPPEVQERIFDPFFTTKSVGKGTGQGLAISHAVVVENHGGTIAVESEPGEGTTFIIHLPVLREGDSSAESISEGNESTEAFS